MTRTVDSLRMIAQELGIKNIANERLETVLPAWSRFREGMENLKSLDLSSSPPTFYVTKKGAADASER